MLKRFKSRWSLQDAPVGSEPRQDLAAADVTRGFKLLARHLRSEGNGAGVSQPVRIVVAGDVVGLLLLNTRAATATADFFARTGEDLRAVLGAKRAVLNDLRMHSNWLSAQIVHDLDHDPRFDSLYNESVAQNVVLFSSDVLVVYAVDLRYQLIAMLQRLQDREYVYELAEGAPMDPQLADAVAALHVLIQRRKGALIGLKELKSWYGLGEKLELTTFSMLSTAYVDIHDTDGLVL
ncbi:hypothetical protein BKA62DRAFT_824543 [Auriculariales sp. MPI-PUGE-AT-0066]|nr:hypothetical protein BKA62DRAFT_824543 [Auriculariales sp. MPI-PUGE-AT-0066]